MVDKNGRLFEILCINKIKKSWKNECFIQGSKVSKGYFKEFPELVCFLSHKSWFLKYCVDNSFCSLDFKKQPHGCKWVDFSIIANNFIFILEMKYQDKIGSVAEKLQTGLFKQNYYQSLFYKHKVFYIYILSPWFRDNCKVELSFLSNNKILFLFSDTNWVLSLLNHIKKITND